MEKNTKIQKGSVKEASPLWVYECRASVPEFIGLKNHQNLLRIWTKNEKNHQNLPKNKIIKFCPKMKNHQNLPKINN